MSLHTFDQIVGWIVIGGAALWLLLALAPFERIQEYRDYNRSRRGRS